MQGMDLSNAAQRCIFIAAGDKQLAFGHLPATRRNDGGVCIIERPAAPPSREARMTVAPTLYMVPGQPKKATKSRNQAPLATSFRSRGLFSLPIESSGRGGGAERSVPGLR